MKIFKVIFNLEIRITVIYLLTINAGQNLTLPTLVQVMFFHLVFLQ